jgi:amino acid permease
MANLSLLGMVCLVAGVSAILAHGFNAFGAAAFSGSWDESSPAVYLWPSSFEAAGSFLGIVIFCFDICSLAFPIEESMQHKTEFSRAVIWAMITVWALYTLFGDLGALLYAHDTARGIGENVLSNLPVHSSLSLLVRWAMACVSVNTLVAVDSCGQFPSPFVS